MVSCVAAFGCPHPHPVFVGLGELDQGQVGVASCFSRADHLVKILALVRFVPESIRAQCHVDARLRISGPDVSREVGVSLDERLTGVALGKVVRSRCTTTAPGRVCREVHGSHLRAQPRAGSAPAFEACRRRGFSADVAVHADARPRQGYELGPERARRERTVR